MNPRVGLVTCLIMPEPDPDADLMAGALHALSIDAEHVAWNDMTVDWSAFDLCVLRSCWDYHTDAERFLRWIDHAAARTTLLNPAPVVRANIHKRYLADLERAGLPIVPTAFLDRGCDTKLGTLLRERGWDDVVVKPCVSAGSANTRRFRPEGHAEGERFLASLLPTRDMMVQPYLPSVETGGERSVIWIDGSCTHIIEKQPRFHDQDESVSEALAVTPEEAAMTRKAVEVVGEDLLYARLDTMRGPRGERLVSELELIEPSLFFVQSLAALRAFVRGVERRVR